MIATYSQLNNAMKAFKGDDIKAMASSIVGLDNKQIANVFTINNVTKARALDVLSINASTDAAALEQLQLIRLTAAKNGVHAASIKQAAANTAVAATGEEVAIVQTAETATTGTLGAAFKGLGASIWASVKAMWAFLTTNPVGWAILAAASIFVVVKAFDAITTTVGEASDALEESQKSLEETTSKLESLQSELKTANERIAELQKLADDGTITLIEQNELEKLKKANDELHTHQV